MPFAREITYISGGKAWKAELVNGPLPTFKHTLLHTPQSHFENFIIAESHNGNEYTSWCAAAHKVNLGGTQYIAARFSTHPTSNPGNVFPANSILHKDHNLVGRESFPVRVKIGTFEPDDPNNPNDSEWVWWAVR